MNSVWLVNLDQIPYADALALQHRIKNARKRGALNDTLLFLPWVATRATRTFSRRANFCAMPGSKFFASSAAAM
ncbi:MAG: hypothetical protein HZC40_15310 [Chloroflexi bacterium]|nr:hypothetical protein [Chloroflexota bacterium]